MARLQPWNNRGYCCDTFIRANNLKLEIMNTVNIMKVQKESGLSTIGDIRKYAVQKLNETGREIYILTILEINLLKYS